jgi:UrcA family protein
MAMSSSPAWALLAAGAVGVALAASSASAQEYGPSGPGYYQGPPEQVEVYAPRHRSERSDIGAPIQDVAISRPVRFDDLDLRTEWGARELRARIEYAARDMCNQLDTLYPVSTSDSPPCFRTAVDNAMYQADAAIDAARSYDDSE